MRGSASEKARIKKELERFETLLNRGNLKTKATGVRDLLKDISLVLQERAAFFFRCEICTEKK